jgi:hypothetical protein
MTEPREWDFPPSMRQRRPPPPLEGEIIEPQSERIHRVEIEHRYVDHRRSFSPQRSVIIIALFVLGMIAIGSPGALILIGALLPHWFWVALGVVIAGLVLWNIRDQLFGRHL